VRESRGRIWRQQRARTFQSIWAAS
jgi:hypothetical protein